MAHYFKYGHSNYKTIISVLKTILDANMSEWSKEPVLRSGSESCVGSNPTVCTNNNSFVSSVGRAYDC